MSLVQVTPELCINSDEVSSLNIDQRHYMNGPGDPVLTISMRNGDRHVIRHSARFYGGIDVYDVKRRLTT